MKLHAIVVSLLTATTSAQLDFDAMTIEVLPNFDPNYSTDLFSASTDLSVLSAMTGVPFNGGPSGATIWFENQWSEPVYRDPDTGFSFLIGRVTENLETILVYDIHFERSRVYLLRDGERIGIGSRFGGETRPGDLSGDGTTVVGTLRRDEPLLTPFIFRGGEVMEIGEPSDRFTNGQAISASFDGNTIGGVSDALDVLANDGDLGQRAWIWTPHVGFTMVPLLDDPRSHYRTTSVSSNGRFVVGTDAECTCSGLNFRGWIWEIGGLLVEIERPLGWSVHPSDVSNDGQVVVGRMNLASGTKGCNTSFIWTRDSGLFDIGPLIRDQLSANPGFEFLDRVDLDYMNDEGTLFVGTYEPAFDEPRFVFYVNIPRLP